jgi:hypothetical protein
MRDKSRPSADDSKSAQGSCAGQGGENRKQGKKLARLGSYKLIALVVVLGGAFVGYSALGAKKTAPTVSVEASGSSSTSREKPAARLLHDLAADVDIGDAAFPPGSGRPKEVVSHSSSRSADNTPKPVKNEKSTVTRHPREPNRSRNAGAGFLSLESGSKQNRSVADGMAGSPAIRNNGQTVLREVLGKQRANSGGAARKSVDNDGGAGARSENSAHGSSVPLDQDFAPYGRLIKCELVFTVDSLSLQTPIVGLVMEDVWWNGNLIIPAGTEAFSKALTTPQGDRIVDDGNWTFVMPEQEERTNGRELMLKGIALDRAEMKIEPDGRVRSWSISDGAAGLHGYVVKDASIEEIKLFAATAMSGVISGFAEGLQTREPSTGLAGTLGLTQLKATARNAAIGGLGKGAQDTLNEFAKQILEEVKKKGSYVRVPSGKQFYIFVDQSIDPLAARVGLRLEEKG